MLTEQQIRKAFMETNTAEPLAEGWPGLERFAREIERLVWLDAFSRPHDPAPCASAQRAE